LPLARTQDPGWIIVEEGFIPAREHELESLFAIGNGYAGSRGSLAEGSALSAPATFVAGVFDSDVG
jgi:kojibiose phosphorylase